MTSLSGRTDPVVRRIAVADVAEALVQGLRDFQAAPLYGLAFGALYAAGGLLIASLCSVPSSRSASTKSAGGARPASAPSRATSGTR